MYTHCYGHALKLVINDCIKNTKNFKYVWIMLKGISSLVKKLASRESKAKEIQNKKKRDMHLAVFNNYE